MKLDELAFVNRQLAGLLRSGIPLEGAVKQLSANLDSPRLRDELVALEKDLAAGRSLGDAIAPRDLPKFYKDMLKVGVSSNDLPGMLLMLADHYSRRNAMWSRLKGLLVYPLIVLAMATGISFMISITYGAFMREIDDAIRYPAHLTAFGGADFLLLWLPTVFLAALLVAVSVIAGSKRIRNALRWRLPVFRDAGLTQVAGALALMLRGGCQLADALDLMCDIEKGNRAGIELDSWRARLTEGNQDLAKVVTAGAAFPPMFAWLVSSGGEDVTGGLERARDIYQERAARRSEMLLHTALPVAMVGVGLLILGQAAPLISHMKRMMDLFMY